MGAEVTQGAAEVGERARQCRAPAVADRTGTRAAVRGVVREADGGIGGGVVDGRAPVAHRGPPQRDSYRRPGRRRDAREQPLEVDGGARGQCLDERGAQDQTGRPCADGGLDHRVQPDLGQQVTQHPRAARVCGRGAGEAQDNAGSRSSAATSSVRCRAAATVSRAPRNSSGRGSNNRPPTGPGYRCRAHVATSWTWSSAACRNRSSLRRAATASSTRCGRCSSSASERLLLRLGGKTVEAPARVRRRRGPALPLVREQLVGQLIEAGVAHRRGAVRVVGEDGESGPDLGDADRFPVFADRAALRLRPWRQRRFGGQAAEAAYGSGEAPAAVVVLGVGPQRRALAPVDHGRVPDHHQHPDPIGCACGVVDERGDVGRGFGVQRRRRRSAPTACLPPRRGRSAPRFPVGRRLPATPPGAHERVRRRGAFCPRHPLRPAPAPVRLPLRCTTAAGRRALRRVLPARQTGLRRQERPQRPPRR